jgi:hypothetical protein
MWGRQAAAPRTAWRAAPAVHARAERSLASVSERSFSRAAGCSLSSYVNGASVATDGRRDLAWAETQHGGVRPVHRDLLPLRVPPIRA